MSAISLTDASSRERITTDLDDTLFVEAGAGAGKTTALVGRVVALVASGVPMSAIAAITFTEKAAAELRFRIRGAVEAAAGDAPHPTVRERFRRAVEEVDAAAIGTLHAFAQRILTEHSIEARLPPDVEVLDEVASEIEFEERWRRFRDALLADPTLERCLLLAFAADIRLEDLRHLARTFDDNWDLVSEPQRLPWPAAEPPPIDLGTLLAGFDALAAACQHCDDDADKLLRHIRDELLPYADRLRTAPDEYEVLRLLAEKMAFRSSWGRQTNWRRGNLDEVRRQVKTLDRDRERIRTGVALAALRRLALEVARFTLEAAAQRRSSGRVEFHDLLVLARDLLRGPNGVEVRGALRERYQRLLLDEFQDTDPIQIDLAVLIASHDPHAPARPWQDTAVEPGRLFLVGDPKQSIYRFRRADIALFLQAQQVFGPPVPLTTNFRATPPLIDWVNHVFGQLIREEHGSQPSYQPLDAAPTRTAPPDGTPIVLVGSDPWQDQPAAAMLRDREAADVAEAVLTALTWQVADESPRDVAERWRPARLGDIAILLPARTSLAALEQRLEEAAIPYRAETSSLVYSTREVRDLLAAVRAIADPSDQLALVTALRSPLFGCGDDDLVTYRLVHGGAWHLFAPPPPDLPAEHPVGLAIAYLRGLAERDSWLAPSEILDRITRDRRLFELGFAHGRPRDLWRRLRFVIDHARAWSEAEGGTLREYVEWARMQASESARVAETILPETDDDSVRIMTIHAAKGLEFPIVILSGLTTAPRSRSVRVEVVFPPGQPLGIKIGSSVVTPEFENFRPIDEQMDYHERLRLLYVACTRARDHLVVSLHRRVNSAATNGQRRTNAELLAAASTDAPHQSEPSADQPPPPPVTGPLRSRPLPPLDEWERERTQAVASSGRRRGLSASDVAALAVAELDAGDEKNPRDLELPPWQKGRYGTAIGRAVHAVLQTIDLATGAGLDAAAAAQAAAEGVLDREETVRELAGAALTAPSVREAVRHPRWRETYVATTVGDRTLEGYVDLLYRRDDGLVVVDYKTAGSDADLAARVQHYRPQGGSYALAVEGATGEEVARVVFVFLTPVGASEVELDDLPGAKALVRRLVSDVRSYSLLLRSVTLPPA